MENTNRGTNLEMFHHNGRKLTDPRNYIPKGYHKMPNGKLMSNLEHQGELPGTNKLKNQYNSLLNKSHNFISMEVKLNNMLQNLAYQRLSTWCYKKILYTKKCK